MARSAVLVRSCPSSLGFEQHKHQYRTNENGLEICNRLDASQFAPAYRALEHLRDLLASSRYLATGIATIGLIVAAAAARGYRTQGRSTFYQNTLLAFGLHGLGHLAVSILTRGYTSGVATVPVVVLFWLWATRALQEAGVPNRHSFPAAIALLAGSLAIGHVTAYVLTGNQP